MKDVVERGGRFRRQAKGYALGSGNSIPDYVPVEGFLAMIEAAQEIRRQEADTPKNLSEKVAFA